MSDQGTHPESNFENNITYIKDVSPSSLVQVPGVELGPQENLANHNVSRIKDVSPLLFLQKVLEARRPSHAYLFFGPASSEKESGARAFIKALLCASGKTAACGECRSCRKFESGNHPDFREAAPGEEKIKIEEIRALKEESRYAPLESDWKIYYLSRAERLTLEASQSLLKILEEPPPAVVFVLTAGHPSGVLPTIASRCQRIAFPSRASSETAGVLESRGIPESSAALLARLNVNPEEAGIWNDLVAQALPALFAETRGPADVFEQAAALEDYKAEGEKLLHLLLAFYRDAAVLKTGWEEGLLFPEYKARLKALSGSLSWESLGEKTRLIAEAENHLRRYGNFRLVTENLLRKLRLA